MVAVETAPAEIEFANILEATNVILDQHNTEAPWDNCDGFKHEAKEILPYKDEVNLERGYAPRQCNLDMVITLPEGEDYGLYKWHRERGATKQVAREAVAADRQRTLDQLVKWYSDGWQWWGVACSYSVLDTEYEGSVWGIDSEEYAKDLCEEIALGVALQLESAGYTVTGKPKSERDLSAQRSRTIVSSHEVEQTYFWRVGTPDQWRAEYKRNLALQNWKGE